MELNKEQIIKGLECCGEYTHGTTCNNCPYMQIELSDNDICSNRMAREAHALILSQEQEKEKLGFLISELEKEKRELWEERNRIYNDLQDWKEIAEQYQKQFEDCYEDKEKLTEDVERLRKQCGEIIVECDERDAERLKQVAELTKENERLHASCTELTQCCTKLETLYKIECKRVDTVKADTVRKMKERLMQKILENTVGNDSFAYFLKGYIDQIAKEMLEGKI